MVKTMMVPVSWVGLSREEMDEESESAENALNKALQDGFWVVSSHVISAAGRQLVVLILHKHD